MPRPRQTAIEQLIRLLSQCTADELYMALGAVRVMILKSGLQPEANAALDLREEESNV